MKFNPTSGTGMRVLTSVLIFMLFPALVSAQHGTKVSFKDSLDGKFDLSDFLIEVNGFVPVPTIITEPALGGFGFGFAPIFMKKRPTMHDNILTLAPEFQHVPSGPQPIFACPSEA